MHRLAWFRDAILELKNEHGEAGPATDPPRACKCGLRPHSADEYAQHIAEAIVGVIVAHFEIREFDQTWQTVYGCREPDCIGKGIDRDLHQHQLHGRRIELRERASRPLESRELPDGTSI